MSVPRIQYPKSELVKSVIVDKYRLHKGDGDMWPITWAADGNLYGAAGDNQDSPMNFWRIEGHPGEREWGPPPFLYLVDNLPMDPKVYCQKTNVHPKWGIKPASLLSLKGRLYFAVQLMNFGDNMELNRQHNISSWIITTDDYGRTWNRDATSEDFYTGRVASPHFLQFGRDYDGARDEYVYAYFPSADDGNSYWENGDCILLGRVHQEKILFRKDWEFFIGLGENGEPRWSREENQAKAVFCYPLMTGENHVSYNKGLKRYIMGNYGFTDLMGKPVPYHQGEPTWNPEKQRSQLTLFEAPEPWGPWSLFYRDDNWGIHGGYNPCFPTKWMSDDGKTMWMVYSGSEEDYNFTVQKLTLVL
jgi:hypothetical protein